MTVTEQNDKHGTAQTDKHIAGGEGDTLVASVCLSLLLLLYSTMTTPKRPHAPVQMSMSWTTQLVRILLACLLIELTLRSLFPVHWSTDPWLAQVDSNNNNNNSSSSPKSVSTTTTTTPSNALSLDSLETLLQHYMKQAPSLASKLPVSKAPSRQRPLVFFHLRKASGSGMRVELMEHAKANNLDAFVPCYFGTNCQTYTVPLPDLSPDGKKHVYAGHLHYSNVKNALSIKANKEYGFNEYPAIVHTDTTDSSRKTWTVPDDGFDCVAAYRPTVPRVVSCWQFRFRSSESGNVKARKDATAMSVQDWQDELPLAMSRFAEGCNNEMARTLGTMDDEDHVNSLSSANPMSAADIGTLHTQLDVVLQRVGKCLPILKNHRCEESQLLVEHYVPWFAGRFRCDAGKRSYQASMGTTGLVKDLSEEAQQEILRQNVVDELSYRFAERMFDELVSIVNKTKTVSEKKKESSSK